MAIYGFLFSPPDTKAEANHFLWEKTYDKSKRPPGKRGKTKISVTDLTQVVEVKREIINRMEHCVSEMHRKEGIIGHTIDESDLEG